MDGALAVVEQAEAHAREGYVAQATERVALAWVRLWLTRLRG